MHTRQPQNSFDALQFVLKWAVLLYALLVFYITTVPFDFDLSLKGIAREWRQAEKIPLLHTHGGRLSGADLTSNIILFIPLGFLLMALFEEKRRDFRIHFYQTAILSFAYTFFIEAFQLLIEDRFSSANDVLMNTIGGMLGAGLYPLLFQYIRPRVLKITEHLRNHPLWLFWGGLVLVQVFVAFAPLHLYIKVHHLFKQIGRLLASLQSFPGVTQAPLTQQHIETFLMGMLIAASLAFVLKFQKPLPARTMRWLYGGLLAFYPVLSFLTIAKRAQPFGLPEAFFGLLGVLSGILLFFRRTDPGFKRNQHLSSIKWNRIGLRMIFAALFLVHFFFPFKLKSYQVWLHLLETQNWLFLPDIETMLSTEFLLDKILIMLMLAPIGYAFSHRSLALALKDRITRIFAMGLVTGLVIELLQFGIPGQNAELVALPFYPLGAIAGALFERWWRHTQIQMAQRSPLRHFLAIFRTSPAVPVER